MPGYNLSITPTAESQIRSIMDNPAKKGLQKQLIKAFNHLADDPRHPALKSHPLKGAEKAYGVKVWTSYVQNRTPQAHRILWAYGKEQGEIVILGVVPHY